MKLSEAIVAGAKLHPQAFGSYFDDEKTCALGAAAAVTDEVWLRWMREKAISEGYLTVKLERIYPVLRQQVPEEVLADLEEVGEAFRDYAEDPLQANYKNLIVYLNDREKWSREQIAAWLQPLEEDHANDYHLEVTL